MAHPALARHLVANSLRTGGPFTLRSGVVADWYLDARQTTFDGDGAVLVGEAVLAALDPGVTAVGGMTMGADPVAVATAMAASRSGRALRAFSVRKTPKPHGMGGRLVGPVGGGDTAAIVEDTTSTGSSALDAAEAARSEGIRVVQAITLVDRSRGAAARAFASLGIPFTALLSPEDLGVEG